MIEELRHFLLRQWNGNEISVEEYRQLNEFVDEFEKYLEEV